MMERGMMNSVVCVMEGLLTWARWICQRWREREEGSSRELRSALTAEGRRVETTFPTQGRRRKSILLKRRITAMGVGSFGFWVVFAGHLSYAKVILYKGWTGACVDERDEAAVALAAQ